MSADPLTGEIAGPGSGLHGLTDRLAGTLQEGQESLLALVLTHRGRRDVVCYTSNAEGALRRVEAFCSQEESHRIESFSSRAVFPSTMPSLSR